MIKEQFIDTHSHLALLEHAPQDEILKRAEENGVLTFLSVSTRESDWAANEAAAKKSPRVFYALGVHPHHANEWKDCGPRLLERFKGDRPPERCRAVGEAGLDFHYNLSPREDQIACFEAQIALAKKVDLPIIIHCRDAFKEVFDSIKKVGMGRRRGVMHCFTGDPDQAKAAVKLGLWISFSGILTFRNAETLREAAKVVPDDHLLIETDCPFLTPVPHRGKPNEPSFLHLTAETLAAVRGTTRAEIAKILYANSVVFLGLEPS